MADNEFMVWDYIIFILMLVISAGIGVFYACTGKKQSTTKEFLLADRNMGALPVSLSMLASFMSAVTVLGTPAEMYVYGVRYWLVCIGYCGTIPMAAHFFLPVFYRLNLTSVFEYMEMRYDRGIRLIVSIMYIVQTILYMAIVLYTPALALKIVTGLNVWVSVACVGLVCIFYTALGGMKAVIWTDTFQIVIMFLGLFAIIIKGSHDHGGFGKIWDMMEEGDRINWWDFNPDPRERHTFWTLSIGGAFTWLAIYGVNQSQVQRALCTPSLRKGQLAFWINLPGLTALATICSLCGFVVYAEYRGCDPLTRPDPIKKDQLLPLYVIENLAYPFVPGLFTASVFSGALSTVSSGLNSLAAVVLQDMVKAFCYPNMSEQTSTNLSKGIALAFGALMILLTYVASHLGGVLEAALGLFGMIGGPTLGLFMMGMTNPWSNTKGAYAGFIVGLIATLWLGIGSHVYKPYVPKPPVSLAQCPIDNSTDTTMMSMYSNYTTTTADPYAKAEDKAGYSDFYKISYLYYSLFAVIIVNLVGTIVSFLTGFTDPKTVDPRLMTPMLDTIGCCFPKRWRLAMQCGIDRSVHDDDDEAKLSKAEMKDGNTQTNEGFEIEDKKEAFEVDTKI